MRPEDGEEIAIKNRVCNVSGDRDHDGPTSLNTVIQHIPHIPYINYK